MTLSFLSQPSARHDGSTTSPPQYRSVLGQHMCHCITLPGTQIRRDIATVYLSADEFPRKNPRIL